MAKLNEHVSPQNLAGIAKEVTIAMIQQMTIGGSSGSIASLGTSAGTCFANCLKAISEAEF